MMRLQATARQRGFAMIAIIMLIVLVSAYLIANAVTRTNVELTNAREQRSMDALRQAKAALIAYAASEQWQLYKCSSSPCRFQPGALICPDTDDSGTSPGICGSSPMPIGRVPWQTLGLDDLHDASGERLWLALSPNFRKRFGTTVINSDTQGQLTITGTAPASKVVAIVFAPGQAIQGQNRDPASSSHNDPTAYLEGFNANHDTFQSAALPSDAFNDRLIAITQGDVMAVVEPVVAARIERDVKPYLQIYFSQWGGYPFPAAFASPSPGDNSNAPSTPPQPRAQTAYVGDVTQTSGLLPLTTSAVYSWASGQGSVIKTSGLGTLGAVSCGLSGTYWQCIFDASGPNCGGGCTTTLGFRMEGQVSNVGTTLANARNFLVPPSNVNISPVPSSVAGATLALGLASNGNGRVLYDAAITYNYDCTFGCVPTTFTVTVPMDPTDTSKLMPSPLMSSSPPTNNISGASNTSPITITTSTPHSFSTGMRVTLESVGGNTAANGDWTITMVDSTHLSLNGSSGNGSFTAGTGIIKPVSAWFIDNEWYRQTYYAVSAGYLPGGGGSCTPSGTPSCLTVNNLPPSYVTLNDKQAILVLAGRALNGSSRPSANLADYLEGQNSTPADFVYEHRQGMPTSINDRVIVVSP
jgi:hypothetical protein